MIAWKNLDTLAAYARLSADPAWRKAFKKAARELNKKR